MSESFDEKTQKRMDAGADKLLDVLERATEATKRVRIERACQKCGCKHIDFVEIEDYATALKAAEFLANRGFGRPGAKPDEQDSEKVVFIRKVIFGGDEND